MKIPVVYESFDEIRRDKKYYVDKTELIYELLSSAGNKVTVFIRPRRFGKTMMLSMMESFFSIQKSNCRDLFDGLGRSCIDARDKYEKRGMILEAKKSDKEEDMEKDALEGKQQIIEKEYLRGFTGYDSVICYGISFFQKKALVRKMTFGWTSSPPFRQRLQTDDRSGCVPGAFTALSACTGDEAAYQKELLSRKEP